MAFTTNIQYVCFKSLTRIATDNQTTEELVTTERECFFDKQSVIDWAISKAQPGVRLQFVYSITPDSQDFQDVLASVHSTETGCILCDDFLDKYGTLDVERLKSALIAELSKI